MWEEKIKSLGLIHLMVYLLRPTIPIKSIFRKKLCVLSPPHGGHLNSLKSRELPFTRMALNISWLALQKIPQTWGQKTKNKKALLHLS